MQLNESSITQEVIDPHPGLGSLDIHRRGTRRYGTRSGSHKDTIHFSNAALALDHTAMAYLLSNRPSTSGPWTFMLQVILHMVQTAEVYYSVIEKTAGALLYLLVAEEMNTSIRDF